MVRCFIMRVYERLYISHLTLLKQMHKQVNQADKQALKMSDALKIALNLREMSSGCMLMSSYDDWITQIGQINRFG